MTFRDIRLPPAISFGAVGGPGFRTEIVATESGAESRDATQAKELGSWDISYAARLPIAYVPLQAFFRVVRGRADTWRFKDWSDFAATAAQGVFVLLTSTTFQMYKRYTFSGLTYDVKITLPVAGTITVTGGTSPSVNSATGVVTVASGTPTAWAGEFDRLCRFDTDTMHANTIDRNGAQGDLIIGWSGIPIREVRG